MGIIGKSKDKKTYETCVSPKILYLPKQVIPIAFHAPKGGGVASFAALVSNPLFSRYSYSTWLKENTNAEIEVIHPQIYHSLCL